MATDEPQSLMALPSTLSPDSLDALSELAIVLAKVRTGIQSSAGLATGATPSTAAATAAGGQPMLSFKDVPGATDALKHQLQNARAQVRALPDMDRTVAEQRREMAELETRLVTQRALLERLRDDGLRFGKDGDKMDT
ncbi:hypothetical protein CCM_01017 [Cordyceps militaris CM01]|uniref:Mediator of RNA polymerase II transcription subunit 9 n=2 Tax=Cordyceps militaris TaxID=73501 RepID=G3J7U7_CORMM|nr:uncharacterized protein CCM_01017 [Cordyceps militaris CM01]ATY63102.1 Mediator subunit Med9 [Cordyceps militaris]EGX96361.1 hypothetical protein CCM_01017 [Cordyceps militaris CM01]